MFTFPPKAISNRGRVALALGAFILAFANIINAQMLVVPKSYSAGTDKTVEQPPVPIPYMGNQIGMGNVFIDTRYNNARTIRATDGSVAARENSSTGLASSGEPTLFSSDTKHLLVTGKGGRMYVIGFNPAKFTVRRTGVSMPGPAAFSWSYPRTIYGLVGTALHRYMVKDDWSGLASDTVMFNFANGATGEWGTTTECLPNDFRATWSGSFTIKRGDRTFVVPFSDEGPQGTGHYLVAYRVGTGCTVYDTLAGTVSGSWGTGGAVDDGMNPLVSRFVMHEAGGGQNDRFAMVMPSVRDPRGGLGCKQGDCSSEAPYIWEIGTTHVRPCGPYKCSGHSAKGHLNVATSRRYITHAYADPSGPLVPLIPEYPVSCADMHGTWHNSTRLDVNPLMAVTARVGNQGQPYTCAGQDEVIGIAADGSGTMWRFGQTLSTGDSPYFDCQNAIGVNDKSGRWMAFVSDWGGSLGPDVNGKPMCSVFIMELK